MCHRSDTSGPLLPDPPNLSSSDPPTCALREVDMTVSRRDRHNRDLTCLLILPIAFIDIRFVTYHGRTDARRRASARPRGQPPPDT
jgi:hypothetical protein